MFEQGDCVLQKYYDEFVVLLHTGMRVSKFYGLTFKNLYFENRRINVDHQLLRTRNGEYKIGVTKSMSGRRYIAMDDDVYATLRI